MKTQLLNELTPENFHVCGSDRPTLEALIDPPRGKTYRGTLAHWVVALACLNETMPINVDIEEAGALEVEDLAESYGPDLLGVSQDCWDELEFLPLGKLTERLQALTKQVAA